AAPKNGIIVEFLKSEGLVSTPAIRRSLKHWQGSESRPDLGPYLIEQEALKVDQYVSLISKLETRIQPCAECQAPRYVPSKKTENASSCRRCGNDNPPAPLDPKIGAALTYENYELKKLLGRGAMGVVYQAIYTPAKRLEALKIMLPRFSNERRSKRFDRECAILAKLRHRNIVGVHRAGEYAGLKFLSLTFVEGGDLKSHMADNDLSIPEICDIASQVADGLSASHKEGVVHRDLKPANIFIDRHGTPLIGDFGLAIDLIESSRLTRSGAAVGTPYYMSPEQLIGAREDVGPQADIYALGVIIYQMATGKRPFEGKNIPDLKDQIDKRDYKAISEFRADVPESLEILVKRLLEPDLKHRVNDTQALKEALEWIANPKGAEPELCKTPKKAVWPLIAGLAGILLIFLIALPFVFEVEPKTKRNFDVQRKMERFVANQLKETKALLQFIPNNPKAKTDEIKTLRKRIAKIRSKHPQLFSETGGDELVASLDRGEALSLWLSGGPENKAKAVKLLKGCQRSNVLTLDLARMQLAQGQSQQCTELLRSIKIDSLKDPERRRFYILRAELSFFSGRFQESLVDFDAVPDLPYRLLRLKVEAATVEGQDERIRKELEGKQVKKGAEAVDHATLRALSLARLNPYQTWRRLNLIQKRNLNNPRTLRARALFLKNLGWPEAAREDLDRSLQSMSIKLERWDLILLSGKFALDEGRFTQAKSHFQEALNLVQEWVPSNTPLSIAENINRRATLDRLHSRALLGLGDVADLEKKGEKADEYYSSALDIDPSHCLAYVRKARRLLRQGKRQRASKLLEKALPYEGTEVAARLLQGQMALESGFVKGAEKAYSTAFARTRNSAERADTLLGLARTIEKAGRKLEAQTIRKRAAQHDCKDPVYRRGQRLINGLTGPVLTDERLLLRVLRQIERQRQVRYFPAALTVLNSAFDLSSQRYPEARRKLAKVQIWNDQIADYHLMSGFLNFQQNQARNAVKHFEMAEKLGSPSARANFHKARALIELRQPLDALEAVNQAIEREPWQKQIYILRADIYKNLGKLKEYKEELVRINSFTNPYDAAFETRIQEAFKTYNSKTIWKLCNERPGRATTLFDYGRIVGVDSVRVESLALSLLCLAQAIYRRPYLELNVLEMVNQLISFGNPKFLTAIDAIAKKKLRFSADRHFTLGSLELFQWIKTEQKEGKLLESLTHFEKLLDRRPDHKVAKTYHAFILGMLGYTRFASKVLTKLDSQPKAERKEYRFLTPTFYLAVIKARQNDPASCYQKLAASDVQQRFTVIKEFKMLFPEDMQRSTSFRDATGLR
ncbi:MAG: protein kinase, partial [Planctomycetota bacterium]|nr:protein kinase [Planctomycetota bacterium]